MGNVMAWQEGPNHHATTPKPKFQESQSETSNLQQGKREKGKTEMGNGEMGISDPQKASHPAASETLVELGPKTVEPKARKPPRLTYYLCTPNSPLVPLAPPVPSWLEKAPVPLPSHLLVTSPHLTSLHLTSSPQLLTRTKLVPFGYPDVPTYLVV